MGSSIKSAWPPCEFIYLKFSMLSYFNSYQPLNSDYFKNILQSFTINMPWKFFCFSFCLGFNLFLYLAPSPDRSQKYCIFYSFLGLNFFS